MKKIKNKSPSPMERGIFFPSCVFEKLCTFRNIYFLKKHVLLEIYAFLKNHVLSINICFLRKHILFRKSAFFEKIFLFRKPELFKKYIPFKKSAFFKKTRVGRPIAVFSAEKRIYLVGD